MVRNLISRIIAILLFLGISIASFMCIDAGNPVSVSTYIIVLIISIIAFIISVILWINSSEETEKK